MRNPCSALPHRRPRDFVPRHDLLQPIGPLRLHRNSPWFLRRERTLIGHLGRCNGCDPENQNRRATHAWCEALHSVDRQFAPTAPARIVPNVAHRILAQQKQPHHIRLANSFPNICHRINGEDLRPLHLAERKWAGCRRTATIGSGQRRKAKLRNEPKVSHPVASRPPNDELSSRFAPGCRSPRAENCETKRTRASEPRPSGAVRRRKAKVRETKTTKRTQAIPSRCTQMQPARFCWFAGLPLNPCRKLRNEPKPPDSNAWLPTALRLRAQLPRAPAMLFLASAEAGEIAAAGGAAVRSRAAAQQDHGPARRMIVLLAPGAQILAIAAGTAGKPPGSVGPNAGSPACAAFAAAQRVDPEKRPNFLQDIWFCGRPGYRVFRILDK